MLESIDWSTTARIYSESQSRSCEGRHRLSGIGSSINRHYDYHSPFLPSGRAKVLNLLTPLELGSLDHKRISSQLGYIRDQRVSPCKSCDTLLYNYQFRMDSIIMTKITSFSFSFFLLHHSSHGYWKGGNFLHHYCQMYHFQHNLTIKSSFNIMWTQCGSEESIY